MFLGNLLVVVYLISFGFGLSFVIATSLDKMPTVLVLLLIALVANIAKE